MRLYSLGDQESNVQGKTKEPNKTKTAFLDSLNQFFLNINIRLFAGIATSSIKDNPATVAN